MREKRLRDIEQKLAKWDWVKLKIGQYLSFRTNYFYFCEWNCNLVYLFYYILISIILFKKNAEHIESPETAC